MMGAVCGYQLIAAKMMGEHLRVLHLSVGVGKQIP